MQASPTRVARRWLEATRPIRIDRSEVNRLVDRLIRTFMAMSKTEGPEEPVGNRPNPFIEDDILVKNPLGQDHEVGILMISKPSRSGRWFIGGGMGTFKRGQRKGQPVVIIEMNGRFPWMIFTDPEIVRRDLTTLLLHELTHALDPLRGQELPIQGRIPNEGEVDLGAYYNNPGEVRARMRDLYETIGPLVRKAMKGALAERWGLGGTVARMLRSNQDWRDMEPYLTRQNKNRILKGIVTAFEDEGIAGPEKYP